jgi:hypothetical protein
MAVGQQSASIRPQVHGYNTRFQAARRAVEIGAAADFMLRHWQKRPSAPRGMHVSTASEHNDTVALDDMMYTHIVPDEIAMCAATADAGQVGVQTACEQVRHESAHCTQAHINAPGLPGSLQRYDAWFGQAMAASARPVEELADQPAQTRTASQPQPVQTQQADVTQPQTYN